MNIRFSVHSFSIITGFLAALAVTLPGIAGAQECYVGEEGYLKPGDWDGDNALDENDACPRTFDPGNDDYDLDGKGDVCDNCALVRNSEQRDLDQDGIGDACDDDIDGDLVLNLRDYVKEDPWVDTETDTDSATDDTMVETTTETAADTESDDTAPDSQSDAGTDSASAVDSDSNVNDDDTDSDSDSSTDEGPDASQLQSRDNCPLAYNPNQLDIDSDGEGDACDSDLDEDGIANELDFCPFDKLISAYVSDSAHTGINCVGDSDGDGIPNYQVVNGELLALDNCPFKSNPDQADLDGDGIGDGCDVDLDGDGIMDSADNCSIPVVQELVAAYNGKVEKNKNSDIALVDPASWSAATWLAMLSNPLQEDLDRDGVGDACDFNFEYPEAKVDAAGTPVTGFAFQNCPVVLDDPKNCIDLSDPRLRVYSPIVIASKTSDSPTRLRIFANRENERLRYTWTLAGGDSEGITLRNASGIVNCSSQYEYHYRMRPSADENGAPIDLSAAFETKLSGTYELRLYVQVLNADNTLKAGDNNSAETFVIINVSGVDDYVADSCGCETVGHSGAALWMWLLCALLLAMALRRRFIQ